MEEEIELIPVEGRIGLYRDSDSTAIINYDKKAYNDYMKRKKIAEGKNSELNTNINARLHLLQRFSALCIRNRPLGKEFRRPIKGIFLAGIESLRRPYNLVSAKRALPF